VSKHLTTAERLAHIQTIHKRAADVRRREDAMWSRVEKARFNLTEDAAREWRPDLAWAWVNGRLNGFVAPLGGGAEMCADVCVETGQFHVEIAFEREVHLPGAARVYYQRASEARTLIMGAGFGDTLADAAAVALANYNAARATLVPDAAALLAEACTADAVEPKP
jgi:hypothetical protein